MDGWRVEAGCKMDVDSKHLRIQEEEQHDQEGRKSVAQGTTKRSWVWGNRRTKRGRRHRHE